MYDETMALRLFILRVQSREEILSVFIYIPAVWEFRVFKNAQSDLLFEFLYYV